MNADSQIIDQANPINVTKIRLAELDREEKELVSQLEKENEKTKHILPTPSFFIAVDIFIAIFVLGKIFYQLWIRELPDVFHSILILIGLVLMAIRCQRFRQNYLRRKLTRQIENRLKTIAKTKTEMEKLIDL